MRSALTWCLLLVLLWQSAYTDAVASGSALRYYTSRIDGSSQPYGLYVPKAYQSGVAHPVIFIGHGFGGSASASFNSTQTTFADANGFLLVNLQGRGNTFYDGVGEVDFFDVLAELRALCNVDMRRLYFEGASMGATGAFRLGVRHPDVLAAVGGVDGWGDYRSWYAQWYGPARNPSYVEPFRLPNLTMASSVDVAEGAKWQNLYLITDTGDTTVPSVNAYNLDTRLTALGSATPAETDYQHTLQTASGGHCAAYTAATQLALYNYFNTKAQPPTPAHVTVKTTRMKYGKLYWASIDRVQRVNEAATLDAVVTGNTVAVSTANVLQYTLTLDASLCNPAQLVTILTNGLPSYSGPVGTVTLSAALHDSGAILGWSDTNSLPGGLHKSAAQEGPIGDAYTSKFLVVYGTAGSGADTTANKAEADAFCTNWNSWMGASITSHADSSVSANDVATSNLILYGTAQSNSLLAGIAPLLPIQVTNSGISVGDRQFLGPNYGAYFVYPNPQSPTHYVVVSHRSIPGAQPKDLEALPWYWPDYVVFDTNKQAGLSVQEPKVHYLPDTFVDAGYFNAAWQLNEGPARPDLLVRTAAQPTFTGGDTYNLLDEQTVTQTVAPSTTATYYVQVHNNSAIDDSYVLTGTPSGNGMTVTYTDLPTGTDVTALLTGTPGWRIPLDKNAARTLRVDVTLAGSVPAGAGREVLLTAVSAADGAQSDQVKAVTRAATPPTAQPDAYQVNERLPLLVPAPGVLANDSDDNGEAPVAAVAGNPAHGTLSLSADGSFTYLPDAGFVGADSFTYTANDALSRSAPALVTITVRPTGMEGDIAGRPDGNGLLTIADWVQAGRFAAGLDTPAPGSEFQRADSAPMDVLGDGRITVADWVQTGRYALGLDPPASAGGPTLPFVGKTNTARSALFVPGNQRTRTHTLSLDAITLAKGSTGTVRLWLDAQGDEAGLGCSLSFDPRRLAFRAARLVGNPALTLQVNALHAAAGTLGLACLLPPPQALRPGRQALVELTFQALPTAPAGTTPLRFSDTLLPRELATPTAHTLPTTYLAGSVHITTK